jgi:hypothetical protein
MSYQKSIRGWFNMVNNAISAENKVKTPVTPPPPPVEPETPTIIEKLDSIIENLEIISEEVKEIENIKEPKRKNKEKQDEE